MITTLGFFGYLLRHARLGGQTGQGSASAGLPAWIRPHSGESRAAGQRPSNLRWPSVRVSAIMAPSRGQPGAVTMDGKLYGAGEEIRGIRIVEIEGQSVLLEYRGEQRRLQSGQSTRP